MSVSASYWPKCWPLVQDTQLAGELGSARGCGAYSNTARCCCDSQGLGLHMVMRGGVGEAQRGGEKRMGVRAGGRGLRHRALGCWAGTEHPDPRQRRQWRYPPSATTSIKPASHQTTGPRGKPQRAHGSDGDDSHASGYYHAPIREIRNRKGDYREIRDKRCTSLCPLSHSARVHTRICTHMHVQTAIRAHIPCYCHLNICTDTLCPATWPVCLSCSCIEAGRYMLESRQEQTATDNLIVAKLRET